ncbi:MAG: hypothetical protein AAGG09_04950 [Pseudomonadota bacterium]
METDWRKAHSEHATLREIILEHAFVADLLKHLWAHGVFDVEILRSEFDARGYDLALSRGDVTRHIQLKAKRKSGKTRHVPISHRLARRAAGCVIVFVVNDDLRTDHYLWFGGAPADPLPSLEGFARSRHTKGDASGVKAERRHHVQLPLSRCTALGTMDEVASALLGPLPT